MFLKQPGSTKFVINDLYTVWLPPVPPRNQILFHELKKSDQYWRRTPLPKFYNERRADELARQEEEKKLLDEGVIPRVKYFDPVLERYRRQEWHRRIYGVWFMNNGVPTYLTGTHYYYLQWCKLDHPENDGYPLFYIPQLKRFYFRQLCLEDPFSLGYLIVGPRGFGKTSEESAALLENMTKGHNKHAAIQSKNDADAEEVIFQEKMVPMFNNLPDFFKPEYSHGTEPKNRMIFRRPSKKGKDAKKVKHGEDFELGNTILCYPPHTKAIDGKTLSDVIHDEIAKLKPQKDQDAYERHSVAVRTVFRNRRKVGIIRATTTVEEMEQGGDECHEIWLESDPRKRDENGYTLSKIYKLFVSAVDTQTDLADKHGFIPEDAAYAQIMAERAPYQNDNYKLSLLMRKNPTTEEEAFLKNQNDCVFDVMIISKRITELKISRQYEKFKSYMPEWVNGKQDGEVELVPYKDGPLKLFYEPDTYWSKERKLLNNCKSYVNDKNKKLWLPCNNDLFRASTDPIKYVKTTDPRASKMAAHGMMKYIPDLDNGKELSDWTSHNIMWEYCARYTDPELNYEDVIKLMRYFGHSIMPEGNAGEFAKHMVDRGYGKFMIVRKHFDFSVLTNKHTKNKLGNEQATHSNTEVIESYTKRIAAFVRRHGHRIPSLPLLEQLLRFDPQDPTTFDLVVSFGFGVLAMEADLDDYFSNQKEVETVMNYFRKYDIGGNQSKLIYTEEGDDEEQSSDFDDPNYLRYLMNS